MFSNHFLNKLEQSQDEPYYNTGFPGDTSGKEPACQCRRCKRQGFSPQTRKIPWRWVWQPTPVFLPGESLAQRSLAGYSLWGRKGVGHDLATKQQQHSTHSLEIWVRQERRVAMTMDMSMVAWTGAPLGQVSFSAKKGWEVLASYSIFLKHLPPPICCQVSTISPSLNSHNHENILKCQWGTNSSLFNLFVTDKSFLPCCTEI